MTEDTKQWRTMRALDAAILSGVLIHRAVGFTYFPDDGGHLFMVDPSYVCNLTQILKELFGGR